jgi:hypothetical protein
MDKTNGSKPKCLTFGIILLLSMIFVKPTYCLWNDCQITCQPGSLVKHAFLPVPPINTYTLRQSCSASCGPNAYGGTITFETNYFPGDKTARERITIECNTIVNVADVKASCPDDPWLNTVSCSTVSATGDPRAYEFLKFPKSYPISAGFLSPSQKQQLKEEKEQKSQPTIILSPGAGQSVCQGSVWTVRVQHRKDFKINKWEDLTIRMYFQANNSSSQETWDASLNNPTTSDGITTGTLLMQPPGSKGPGKWGIAARINLFGMSWSPVQWFDLHDCSMKNLHQKPMPLKPEIKK